MPVYRYLYASIHYMQLCNKHNNKMHHSVKLEVEYTGHCARKAGRMEISLLKGSGHCQRGRASAGKLVGSGVRSKEERRKWVGEAHVDRGRKGQGVLHLSVNL